MLTRRKTLGLIGGGAVLAAGAATAGFVATRTPNRALAPWAAAGEYEDPRLRALSFALLAPNPHNRQPWLAELVASDTVVIYRDPSRDLPVTDPDARQLTIGMGCFLELMDMAAAEEGLTVETDLYPDGEGASHPVARCRFVGGTGGPDPLFAHVIARRSCKEPFEQRAVPAEAIDLLAPYAEIITDPARVATLRDLTWAAWKIEANTPRALQESVDLMRLGKAEINAQPDGIDLGGPLLEALMAVDVLNHEALVDPDSTAFAQGAAMYEEMLHATPAYAVMVSDGNSRASQITVGRQWLRLNLAATGLGLGLHPVSQALQEFPEMADQRAAAHDLLAPSGGTVQMIGRLGYGPSVPRTPRWPLETRLIA